MSGTALNAASSGLALVSPSSFELPLSHAASAAVRVATSSVRKPCLDSPHDDFICPPVACLATRGVAATIGSGTVTMSRLFCPDLEALARRLPLLEQQVADAADGADRRPAVPIVADLPA